jgi:ribulose-phosphate 3-epimerase
MTDNQLAPSILAADFARLGEESQHVIASGADIIHFDVMDNHYVPNLTIGPMVCRALREYGIQAPIDVHLMVRPVDQLINEFATAGATYISIHPEATDHLDRSLQQIKDLGCQVGLAFNPATPLHYLDYTLDKIDMVLLMSVNPGFGGQSFIPATLNKLQQVRQQIDASGRAIRLEVDGGVKVDNIAEIAAAGADTFVSGSGIFDHADITDTNRYSRIIQQMREAIAITTH